jgi:hypothetical protein
MFRVPTRCCGGTWRPVTSLWRALMESVDYCPMGSPVLDKTKHLGETWSRYTPLASPVERILLLTPLYHTLASSQTGSVRWTGWRGTQWGQMDKQLEPVVASAPGDDCFGSAACGVACWGFPPAYKTLQSTISNTLPCFGRASLTPHGRRVKIVTWLILPVVICLSQRLSHACLSISNIYRETANGSLNQLSFIW